MTRLMDIRGICIASIVLQTIIFGSGSAVTKLAYTSISPLWCLTLRFGLAAAVFAVFFGPRMLRGLRQAHITDWLPAAVCMAVSYISCNVALNLTTATNVGFLMALPVVFTPLVAAVVLHRPYQLVHLPFQIAVVVGLYLLCSSGGSFSFGIGELCGLITAISLAGALVFGEHGLKRVDVVTVSGTQIFLTFVASLVGAVAFDHPLNLANVRPLAWGVIVLLALASTCLTFALQNMALKRLPSSMVSMILTGEPIFTAFFSWVVLGETLSTIGFVGAVIIVVCVVGETWADGRLPAQPVPAQDANAGLVSEHNTVPTWERTVDSPAFLGAPVMASSIAMAPPHVALD